MPRITIDSIHASQLGKMDCSEDERRSSCVDVKRNRSASTASSQNSMAPLNTLNRTTHSFNSDTTDRMAFLSTMKSRLSGVFSTSIIENPHRASTGDLAHGRRESKYWRPMPYQEQDKSMKKLYFAHNRDGCVTIVGADKTSVRILFEDRTCQLITDCVRDQHKTSAASV